MKVVAFNGSPNKKGNTYHALNIVGDAIKAEGIDFEIVQVGSELVRGCLACGRCALNLDDKCVIKGDSVNEWLQMMKSADGILLGAPVHYSGIAATMKAFLDRAFFVQSQNGGFLRHKAGASLAVVRRSGGTATFDQLNHYITYAEMFMATSSYWNVTHGRAPGEVLQDDEGSQIMRVLGKNLAYLIKMKEATKETVEAPVREAKIVTNFIR